MSQVTRWYEGRIVIDPNLLDDIDGALGMDEADAAHTIVPLTDRVRAHWAAYRNPEHDDDLVGAVEMRQQNDPPHSWLKLMEVDSVQRLRGSLVGGTVDGEFLSEVRNMLDGLTLSFSSECGGLNCCYECDWCRFLVLRDRVDVALDRAGLTGPAYYNPPTDDPDEVWRTRVLPLGAASPP